MNHLIRFAVKCHYCEKEKPPSSIITWPGNVKICANCLDAHRTNLELFSTGNPPQGCSTCQATWEILEQRTATGNIRGGKMHLVSKDGVYLALCGDCLAQYVEKAKDRFPSQWRHQQGHR